MDFFPEIVDVEPGGDFRPGPEVRCVQFTRRLSDRQHRRLGDWLAEHPEASLRVYGNYRGEIVDTEFLSHYRGVAGLYLDTMYGDAPDLAGLRFLPDNLARLHLGIPSGDAGEALLGRTTALDELAISRHKRLPKAMGGLRRVRTLYVEGPVKDLGPLEPMTSVEDLTLRSVTVPDLTSMLGLRSLRSLDIKLGGIRDLSLLPRLGPLTYLELWLIRGLADVSAIGEVVTLEKLKLESLRQVTSLPDLARLERLTEVELSNLKGLTDLRALATAPNLEHLLVIDAGHLAPEALLPLVGHPRLTSARIGLGSTRKNEAVRRLLNLASA